MFMDYIGAFSFIYGERRTRIYIFGSLLMSFISIMDFSKEIPSLLSLIDSIVFNNSIRVKLHLLNLLIEYDKWIEH